MRASELPIAQTRMITPRALRGYAEGLGWSKVEGVNGKIVAYQSPISPVRQLIIPLDEKLDDYGERTAEAVVRLAQFENRSPIDVLDHLLTLPADILGFREVSPESEAGDISLEHGSRLIEGTKKALLAVAHSVEIPQLVHPRLSRDAARQFLSRCRMTTGRGSFVLNVACVLDRTVALPGSDPVPFTRRVTTLFLDTLFALNEAVESGHAVRLADTTSHPGMSANLCEALGQLRPSGDRSHLTVSVAWSRAMVPGNAELNRHVQLRQETFELAEALTPILRSQPQPKPVRFFGYVESLHGGAPDNDQPPFGEVRLRLFETDEELRAKVDLSIEQYAIAGRAHLANLPVMLSGTLFRSPRLNRIESIRQFDLVPFHKE